MRLRSADYSLINSLLHLRKCLTDSTSSTAILEAGKRSAFSRRSDCLTKAIVKRLQGSREMVYALYRAGRVRRSYIWKRLSSRVWVAQRGPGILEGACIKIGGVTVGSATLESGWRRAVRLLTFSITFPACFGSTGRWNRVRLSAWGRFASPLGDACVVEDAAVVVDFQGMIDYANQFHLRCPRTRYPTRHSPCRHRKRSSGRRATVRRTTMRCGALAVFGGHKDQCLPPHSRPGRGCRWTR